MTPQELKRAVEAAREFEVSEGEITWRLRFPSLVVMRQCIRMTAGAHPVAEMQPLLMLGVRAGEGWAIEPAVIGWTGPRLCHFVPGADTTPQEFAPELLEAAADLWPDLYDKAFIELLNRYNRSKAKQEAELKN